MNGQKTILLVEDNPHDEMLIMRALRKVNLAAGVDIMRDGQQALDYLFGEGEFPHRRNAPLPTVVLLDVGLPRVSGLEVLEAIRRHPRTRTMTVVILTSSDEERDLLRGYEGGANSFVRKPLDSADFGETVARLGNYWLAVNEPPPFDRPR